jgi:hypothetical protein
MVAAKMNDGKAILARVQMLLSPDQSDVSEESAR